MAPLLGWSQVVSVDADKAWLQANEWVGQFHRGHADVLKWEQSHAEEPGSNPTAPVQALDLRSPEAAVELAWKAHRSMANTLARLGHDNRALVLAGRWAELDPTLSVRIEGLDEVVGLAMAARKAWVQATASQLALAPAKSTLDAAQLAQELGQRMVAVGNWSKLAQAAHQQAWATAQLNWQRAQYAAAQDQTRLLQLLELGGKYPSVRLANALPAVPDEAMTQSAFNDRLQKTQVQVHALRRDRHRGVTLLAYRAYLASHVVATITANDVLKLQDFVTDETQLHYNGMLKSTWDLLGEVKNQAQARAGLIRAQRDFALATLDLESALFGNEPDALVLLGAGAADSAPKAH